MLTTVERARLLIMPVLLMAQTERLARINRGIAELGLAGMEGAINELLLRANSIPTAAWLEEVIRELERRPIPADIMMACRDVTADLGKLAELHKKDHRVRTCRCCGMMQIGSAPGEELTENTLVCSCGKTDWIE